MKVAAGILGLIAILTLRYVLNDWFRNHVIATATGKAASCLMMVGSTTSPQEGRTFIIGNIRNDCGRKFGNVTIVFKLDRPSGPTENLPQAVVYAYSSDVEPGEIRKFKTFIPIPRDATYRFDGINAY